MRKAKKTMCLLLAVMLAVMLSGCGEKITRGEVIDKKFTPCHSEVKFIYVVTSNGKTSSTKMIPYVYRYPDTYTITITAMDEDGNRQKATYRVTKEVFETVQIGDEFIYTKDMEPSEPEYRREEQEG